MKESRTRNNIERFRTRSSTYGYFFLVFIFGGLCIQTAADSNLRMTGLTFAYSALILAILYSIMFRPQIIIFDEGIEIINPLTRHTIPWRNVVGIEARYAMSVALKNGREIYAWAAPAPSRYHSRRIHDTDLKGLNIGSTGQIRPGESPRSDSGVARILATSRFEAAQNKSIGIVEERFIRDWKIPLFCGLCLAAIALLN